MALTTKVGTEDFMSQAISGVNREAAAHDSVIIGSVAYYHGIVAVSYNECTGTAICFYSKTCY